MECSEGTFKPFGIVSNESLRVGTNVSFRKGSGDSSVAGDGGKELKKQQQKCGRSSSGSSSSWKLGNVPVGRGLVVLLATPQELGDRCVKFIKEQQSRLHIMRRCAVMLACWPKYRIS